MNYGEKILAEINALREQVNNLYSMAAATETAIEKIKQRLPDPFEVQMHKDVKMPEQTSPPARKRGPYRKVTSKAVQERIANYMSEDDLSPMTRKAYENILYKLIDEPRLLERLCQLKNAGTLYEDIVEVLCNEFSCAPASKKTLGNYLPVANRYGLVKREGGKYIFVGETKAQ